MESKLVRIEAKWQNDQQDQVACLLKTSCNLECANVEQRCTNSIIGSVSQKGSMKANECPHLAYSSIMQFWCQALASSNWRSVPLDKVMWCWLNLMQWKPNLIGYDIWVCCSAQQNAAICHGYLSIHLFYLSIHPSISIFLSIFLSLYLSVYMSFYLSIYLILSYLIYPSIHLSIFLSIQLSICLSIYLSICLSIFVYLNVYRSSVVVLYIYLSIYLPIYLYRYFYLICWNLI